MMRVGWEHVQQLRTAVGLSDGILQQGRTTRAMRVPESFFEEEDLKRRELLDIEVDRQLGVVAQVYEMPAHEEEVEFMRRGS